MELNLIVESKNFDNDEKLKSEIDKSPCELCIFGQGFMCVERKHCRWNSHREIFIKKEVIIVNKKKSSKP
jgi:hypothetical protein